ncbi:MAG: flagellar motor switch protein FliN [Chloroflexota bacterium]
MEKAVATEAQPIGVLTASQTAKLGEFGQNLSESAMEALGTTLDKKLELLGTAVSELSGSVLAADFIGVYVVAKAEIRLADGATSPGLVMIGEDEASELFGVSSADAGGEDEYTAKLEEAVNTTLSDLADFLTLSISVNSGAQMQFGMSEVHVQNTAMTPLDLAAVVAPGDLVNLQLDVSAEGSPSMRVSLLFPSADLPRVLASVDPAEAPPAPAPKAAVAAAPPAASRQEPRLTPLPTNQHGQPEPVVRPAQFASFGSSAEQGSMTNIDLILDISLRVTVELGRKLMSVRDILALGPGSVVELDKLAGEPVDVLVNDRLVATGEVVVADENFGVRITDIVNPAKRISSR